jgi:hypothetical protein
MTRIACSIDERLGERLATACRSSCPAAARSGSVGEFDCVISRIPMRLLPAMASGVTAPSDQGATVLEMAGTACVPTNRRIRCGKRLCVRWSAGSERSSGRCCSCRITHQPKVDPLDGYRNVQLRCRGRQAASSQTGRGANLAIVEREICRSRRPRRDLPCGRRRGTEGQLPGGAEVASEIDTMRVTKRRGKLGRECKQRPPGPQSKVFSHPAQRLPSTQ